MTETGPVRYALISPVRNEEALMRRTLDSVVAQSVPPDLWVIVDDGSTDASAAILADYSARHAFIQVVHRPDRGERLVGPGVVEAFYDGWAIVGPQSFDFVGKLDMDIVLPLDYFERLLTLFGADARLGTVSGKAYFPAPSNPEGRLDGDLVSEHVGDDVSLGMTKLWRRTCFEDIGGIAPQLLWDVLDCYRARQLGWKVYSSNDPALRFVHLRPMGSSHKSILTGRRRWGRGHWITGSCPLFVLATCVNRARYRPYLIGGAAMMVGYLHAALRREPKPLPPDFRRYVRQYQRAMLRYGRAEAVRRHEAACAHLWQEKYG